MLKHFKKCYWMEKKKKRKEKNSTLNICTILNLIHKQLSKEFDQRFNLIHISNKLL